MSELEQWWDKGAADDFTYVVDTPGYKIKVYRATYGDFIKAYMDHLTLPWWRRRPGWKAVEKKMRAILNNRTQVQWFDKQ